ncbi:hypothetical protein BDP27DRAFT_1319597 [Rhodocollybia butyracea]|uniref:Uncharacterized protein n=1 Tax=Rhodocollybia butyracea TaxID=206335 RepID=A0A9P5PUY5_9AGAR|nr:hypothetical protein BDP27DRAFT_1319597 [Rhodocollybia butyracea]
MATSLHSPPPTPRRTIRFAPLPDPRRAVLVTDDGTELPLSPLALEGSNIDFLNANVENPSPALSEMSSIPASISLSALNSPTQTPLQTPQSWNVPLPASSPIPHFEKTFSSESDSSNSSNNSASSYSGSSPPTSEISSSASSMYSLTPTQSIDPYPTSTGSSTPTQSMRKSSSLRSRLSSKYNISTDQLLTFGLFRSRSKGKDKEKDSDTDSVQSAQSTGWGNALTRWTSAGSGGPDHVGGVPMYRTQSTQSYKGENVRNKRSSSPHSIRTPRNKPRSGSTSSKLNPAHENGMLSTLHTGQTKKGTRMLNGRVYGAKRTASGAPINPFANAKDDPDPEFVEWGYGGMGSVKNVRDGVGGRVWGRVVGDGKMYGANDTKEQSNAGLSAQKGGVKDDDDDDGSGMGWVRKRREAREREAKEKAEREAQERLNNETLAKEAQEKGNEKDTTEPDVSDARSLASTITNGTTGTATSANTVRNIPSPLPLPDVGDIDSPGIDSSGAVGTPTPTIGSNMVTPTQSVVGTPRARAIEAFLSSPPCSDIRTASMSRQTSSISSTSTIASPGKDEHHVMTAVNVPAPPPMSKSHSHSHSHHRSRSLGDVSKLAECEPSEDKTHSEEAKPEAAIGERAAEYLVSPLADGQNEDRDSPDSGRGRRDSTSSSSASSISSESESESDSEKNENEDDDEEDDETEEEKARKTSLSAGVEKISRHK